MIDYVTFKVGIENLAGKQLSNDEILELCGEPLLKLLHEVLEQEKQNK